MARVGGDSVLIVAAAGLGKRLESPAPKVLVPVNGRPGLDHLFDLYLPSVDRIIVVVHPSAEAAVRARCEGLADRVSVARQERPTGMLDAILVPLDELDRIQPRHVWVTWCDQVAIHPLTVDRLKRMSDELPAPALAFPTTVQRPPYIHIVRNDDRRITAILHRREHDRMPEVGESDMGLFSMSGQTYFESLVEFSRRGGTGAQTGERNFLPFIPWLSDRGADVRTFPCEDEREAIGINTLEDLRAVEEYLLERCCRPAAS
jgi:bifunctional N-acetylglucosamine-1-phosphate-uridyltransferase/glucosamine-1-phosphate-acetyltransferase GlmU-like protein